MASQSPIKRKLVIVGDGTYPRYRTSENLAKDSPHDRGLWKDFAAVLLCAGRISKGISVFDNYVAEIRLDEKPIHLALWDTAGQEEYERLRPMSYSKSHVILIAFAIDTPDSLDNVTAKWIEEVRSICGPTIPVILVGCKVDLRPENYQLDPGARSPWVTREQGERVASAIGARAYKECSALRIQGVDEVFEAATRASMLMRDGVPTHGPSDDDNRHHRRRSSGKVSSEREEGKSWGCCVVC